MLLLKMMVVKSMLRRLAWMKWLPPIAVASPSPVMTSTFSSGCASLIPVANGSALPCAVWTVLKFM